MWVHYTLSLHCDELVGGVPRHPDMVRRWQESRWPRLRSNGEQGPQSAGEATRLTLARLGDQALSDDDVTAVWTGFVSDGAGLALEARAVKAMLKESANVCRSLVRVNGKPLPLRARLAERVFVEPRMIPLGVTEPTGTREKPIHVMTARGPRTALKRTDYVSNAKLTCRLKVLDDGVITEDILRMVLDHGSANGLGADRSQGYGTFVYELSRVDMSADAGPRRRQRARPA